MAVSLYNNLISKGSVPARPRLVVLVDPGKTGLRQLHHLIHLSLQHPVDYFFVGGSLANIDQFDQCVSSLKELQPAPVIIFPGNELQIHPAADALLLLSLISGRNPELLIGKHVHAAHTLLRSGLEIIPTGYLLVESGRLTSVAYMSHTLPIPRDKSDIAVATALAGQLLGLKLIYLEAGSGAEQPVPAEMIRAVKSRLSIPLIVGGGIDSESRLQAALEAGADLVVIGNALESQPELLAGFSALVSGFHREKQV